ncbi:MAG: hypothetical protein SWX82_11305 [Cyanobacteriota bacterium]|nr:hypothetical protein [Cyanobacteriota bacterium]
MIDNEFETEKCFSHCSLFPTIGVEGKIKSKHSAVSYQPSAIALATELQADFIILDDLAARKIAIQQLIMNNYSLLIIHYLSLKRRGLTNYENFSLLSP